jgi:hypothetical protein
MIDPDDGELKEKATHFVFLLTYSISAIKIKLQEPDLTNRSL